jgi:hypothetical protein
MSAVLKTKNFKADEIEKAEFTEVNEHFEIESNAVIRSF